MTDRLQTMMIAGTREYIAVLESDNGERRTVRCIVVVDGDITMVDYSPTFGLDADVDFLALNHAVEAFDRAAFGRPPARCVPRESNE
ncbi:hypothetical protein ACNOYE_32740 [Nannocystaceae bacterium ST9]